GFLKKAALLSMGAALGAPLVFGKTYPSGLIPQALLDSDNDFKIEGKDGLVVLNDKPLNAETPAHLLNEKITSGKHLFVRNNGIPPKNIDVDNWTLTIEGESIPKPVELSIKDLKSKFKTYTYQLTLECGGNGRAEFNPPAKGNQWSTGAVGSPSFTGVRLKDVLEFAGVKSDAVYVGYYGADTHISGDPAKTTISRGVPITKAMENESLIAWAMNGEDIPYQNGHPLRVVFGGWPASTSGKWLTKLVVRNKVHDGAKMEAPSYRVPCEPVEPGKSVAPDEMCIIESMPVKSLITSPKSGGKLAFGKTLEVKGHAWAGDFSVKEMHVSIDFGATWQKCSIDAAANRLAWQHFKAQIKFPSKGYYEVWAKATDQNGKSQPMVVPGWNPKGYLNNACHRIAIKVV
ncbi:MAG: sulfite oxidase, partial [Bacteroidia bacterium]